MHIQAINQQSLETVIPKKPQGKVLLLAGDHKGKRAVLLEKRTDKGIVLFRCFSTQRKPDFN